MIKMKKSTTNKIEWWFWNFNTMYYTLYYLVSQFLIFLLDVTRLGGKLFFNSESNRQRPLLQEVQLTRNM